MVTKLRQNFWDVAPKIPPPQSASPGDKGASMGRCEIFVLPRLGNYHQIFVTLVFEDKPWINVRFKET